MEVKVTPLSNSKVSIEFIVPKEELSAYEEKVIEELGEEIEIPGFRKGNVPKEVLKAHLKKEEVLKEAAQLCIEESYSRALKENNLEPFGEPEVEILSSLSPEKPEDFKFKITVSVFPAIDLPDYKLIASKIERKKIEVSEKEVEDSLRELQESRAKLIVKNGEAQEGDFLEIEYSSPHLEGGRVIKDAFILGRGSFLPGFEENLKGAKAQEEREITLQIPENHSLRNIAGEKIDLKVKIKSVQKVELPQLDDAFAQSLGRFENLEALKKSLREGIQEEKEVFESKVRKSKILNEIAKEAKIELPSALVEREKERMLSELKETVQKKFNSTFEEFLKRMKKTEKEIEEDIDKEAQERVKKYLIVREIAKLEGIKAEPEEVQERANEFLLQFASVKEAEETIDPDRLKLYIEEEIVQEKTLSFLDSLTKDTQNNN